MKIKEILNVINRMFYPQRCICCNKVTKGEIICKDCEPIERITVKVCDKCGLTSKECDCKRNAFHFDGMAGVFYNTGTAKKAVYRLKWLPNVDAAQYIADNIYERIKERFPEIAFDGVCAIPMYWSKRFKRGYNQAELLAKRVAKRLDAVYYKKALVCTRRGAVQHKLKFEERFFNVRGMYKTKLRLDGKTMLLIDDIRTSGATLDECSRLLKRAGASVVVAATALITQNYIEKAYKD